MYMKKRNKRSDAHDMMEKTFKSIIHALRLSGIDTKKCTSSFPIPVPASSSEEEDMRGSEEEERHDREEEDGTEQDH
jgi:hypothetical protein